MKILITGAAGFIGFHLAQNLLKKKVKVIGIDNINNYYSPKLKKIRLQILKKNKNFTFHKSDITKFSNLKKIFKIIKVSISFIIWQPKQVLDILLLIQKNIFNQI